MSKEQSALVLVQSLRTVINGSDEDAAKFICGLMTQKEIEYFIQRDRVRDQIMAEVEAKGSFSMKQIAERCKCSTDLVDRVWEAICKEYPKEAFASASLSFGLPKEDRAQKLVKAILAESGFRIDFKDKENGAIVDIRNGLPPMPCQVLRGKDIPLYLKQGTIQAALLGNDKVKEYTASARLEGSEPAKLVVRQKYLVNTFRMCLAVPKEEAQAAKTQGIGWFNDKIVATSYPATLAQYFNERGVKPSEIIPLGGGVEGSVKGLNAQAIMDIVETGGSLKRNGLVKVGRPLYKGDMSLISLAGARRPGADRQIMDAFLQRLDVVNRPKVVCDFG